MDGVSRFRRWRLVVGGIVVAALALPSVSIAMGASTPFQNVIIANTATSPVPVTGTVSVGNLPATQPVSGTVNVGNLPATEPMQGSLSWDNWGDQDYRSFDEEIPEGKMLVLQTVSFSAWVPAGQLAYGEVHLQGAAPGVAGYLLVLDKVGTFGGSDFYAGTEAITGYGAGQLGLLASVKRNSGAGLGGEVTFSYAGYLVDLP